MVQNQDLCFVNIGDVAFREPNPDEYQMLLRKHKISQTPLAALIAAFGIYLAYQAFAMHLLPAAAVILLITLIAACLILKSGNKLPPTDVCTGTVLDMEYQQHKKNRHYRFTICFDNTNTAVQKLHARNLTGSSGLTGKHVMVARTHDKDKNHYAVYLA